MPRSTSPVSSYAAPMTRDRWLAAFATVLGISADACARDAERSAVPIAAFEVPSASGSSSPMLITAATSPLPPMATPSTPPPVEPSCASKTGQGSCSGGTCSAKSCAATVASSPSPSPPPLPAASSVPDGARVIAALQPKFRACYQTQLSSDPNAEGSVTLTVDIAADGKVTNVTPGGTTLPRVLVACLASVLARASFAAPTHGATALSLPLRFKK